MMINTEMRFYSWDWIHTDSYTGAAFAIAGSIGDAKKVVLQRMRAAGCDPTSPAEFFDWGPVASWMLYEWPAADKEFLT